MLKVKDGIEVESFISPRFKKIDSGDWLCKDEVCEEFVFINKDGRIQHEGFTGMLSYWLSEGYIENV